MLFIGLSYGAIAVASGLPLWLPIAQSVFVVAGASEFLFIGIVAAGGNPIAAALAGLGVNARHLPYGLALPPDITGRGGGGLAGTHLMNDETVVFALAQPDYPRKRAAYWLCGLGVFVAWSGGATGGALIGSAVHDTDAFGLDAMFPAVILALIVPSCVTGPRCGRRGRRRHRAGRRPVPARRPARPARPRRGPPPGPRAPRRRAPRPVKDTTLVVAGMATLAAGTYAIRLAGPALRSRISFPPRAAKLLEAAAVILLAALVATTALTQGHAFSGLARPAGVLVGGRPGLAQGPVPGHRPRRRGHHRPTPSARRALTTGALTLQVPFHRLDLRGERPGHPAPESASSTTLTAAPRPRPRPRPASPPPSPGFHRPRWW